MEVKKRFKLYKSGKRWIMAAIIGGVSLATTLTVIENNPVSNNHTEVQAARVRVNKSGLVKQLGYSQVYQAHDFTPASFNILARDIKTARGLLNNPRATQWQINTITAKLHQDALNLKRVAAVTVNKSGLIKQLGYSRAYQSGQYPVALYNVLRQDIKTAQALLNNPRATQAQVNTIIAKLHQDGLNLLAANKVDKSGLIKQLGYSNSYQAANYTAASFAKLTSDIAIANNLKANPKATQAQLNAIISQLHADALALQPATKVPASTAPSTSNAPTSSAPSTSNAPTSSAPSTSDAPTSSAPSTSNAPTSSAPSTSDAPTSSAPSTSNAPTSSAPSTSDAPTSSAPSTSDAPTSSAPSTSDAPTSSAPSTSNAPTSSAPSTSDADIQALKDELAVVVPYSDTAYSALGGIKYDSTEPDPDDNYLYAYKQAYNNAEAIVAGQPGDAKAALVNLKTALHSLEEGFVYRIPNYAYNYSNSKVFASLAASNLAAYKAYKDAYDDFQNYTQTTTPAVTLFNNLENAAEGLVGLLKPMLQTEFNNAIDQNDAVIAPFIETQDRQPSDSISYKQAYKNAAAYLTNGVDLNNAIYNYVNLNQSQQSLINLYINSLIPLDSPAFVNVQTTNQPLYQEYTTAYNKLKQVDSSTSKTDTINAIHNAAKAAKDLDAFVNSSLKPYFASLPSDNDAQISSLATSNLNDYNAYTTAYRNAQQYLAGTLKSNSANVLGDLYSAVQKVVGDFTSPATSYTVQVISAIQATNPTAYTAYQQAYDKLAAFNNKVADLSNGSLSDALKNMQVAQAKIQPIIKQQLADAISGSIDPNDETFDALSKLGLSDWAKSNYTSPYQAAKQAAKDNDFSNQINALANLQSATQQLTQQITFSVRIQTSNLDHKYQADADAYSKASAILQQLVNGTADSNVTLKDTVTDLITAANKVNADYTAMITPLYQTAPAINSDAISAIQATNPTLFNQYVKAYNNAMSYVNGNSANLTGSQVYGDLNSALQSIISSYTNYPATGFSSIQTTNPTVYAAYQKAYDTLATFNGNLTNTSNGSLSDALKNMQVAQAKIQPIIKQQLADAISGSIDPNDETFDALSKLGLSDWAKSNYTSPYQAAKQAATGNDFSNQIKALVNLQSATQQLARQITFNVRIQTYNIDHKYQADADAYSKANAILQQLVDGTADSNVTLKDTVTELIAAANKVNADYTAMITPLYQSAPAINSDKLIALKKGNPSLFNQYVSAYNNATSYLNGNDANLLGGQVYSDFNFALNRVNTAIQQMQTTDTNQPNS